MVVLSASISIATPRTESRSLVSCPSIASEVVRLAAATSAISWRCVLPMACASYPPGRDPHSHRCAASTHGRRSSSSSMTRRSKRPRNKVELADDKRPDRLKARVGAASARYTGAGPKLTPDGRERFGLADLLPVLIVAQMVSDVSSAREEKGWGERYEDGRTCSMKSM